MIYNFDKGQQYSNLDSTVDFRSDEFKMNSPMSMYNHNNPDIAAAERLALEQLRISGAWVTVMIRTDDNKFDKTWNEDADPTYYESHDFKALFAPPPPEVTLTKFGIDAPTKFEITFSRAELLEVYGKRLLRPGDIIVVPYNSLIIPGSKNGNMHTRITHAQDSGSFRFRWIYLKCNVENVESSLHPKIS